LLLLEVGVVEVLLAAAAVLVAIVNLLLKHLMLGRLIP
jgi:hypothetical protein